MTARLVRLGALANALALALVLDACSAAPVATPVVAGAVPLVASGTAFDRSTLTVPADRPFSLVFENRDGAPHNVSIASAGGTPLFVGDVFTGPAAQVYRVPALPAGRYGFRCDVHAEMTGTLVSQ
jgi:plastocyanin